MKKIVLSIYFAIASFIFLQAQTTADSSLLISLNQRIDDHVVKQDTTALLGIYADDFVFSHGSGKIEGKTGWMKSVAKGNFLARQHDSVTVELHPALAILRGKLSVQKKNKEKIDKYHLKYVRVFAWRGNKWWLVSHVTVQEWHE
jgi:hypothetical protein